MGSFYVRDILIFDETSVCVGHDSVYDVDTNVIIIFIIMITFLIMSMNYWSSGG